MITRRSLRSIRKDFEQQRLALLERIGKEENILALPVDVDPDPADRAQQYTLKQRRFAVLKQLRLQLEQTDAALRRVEAGLYGICAECGKGIDPDRLKVLPYALLCVKCQARH